MEREEAYGGADFVGVEFEEGVVVHPKAWKEAHRKDNFEAWKCPLTAEDDAKINAIDKKFRFWNLCRQMMQLECYQGLDGVN